MRVICNCGEDFTFDTVLAFCPNPLCNRPISVDGSHLQADEIVAHFMTDLDRLAGGADAAAA